MFIVEIIKKNTNMQLGTDKELSSSRSEIKICYICKYCHFYEICFLFCMTKVLLFVI